MERSFTNGETYFSKILKYAFRGGHNTIHLITYNDKIVIPKKIQKYAVKWYHLYLLHPGLCRTEAISHQYFYWICIIGAVQK